ncbi:MAG: site-specific DNA-methyltransferase [Actinobacteria bacterium]|nr:site-specific DNA-methyltransferase [Actinomycetota bacterium]MCL5446112.1 site-specific DNA-methyltransferase [Actinomycetota bacterium]
MVKRSTSTSAFGVSRRESHDATGFYQRFTPPELSSESEIADHRALDKLIVGDARRMNEIPNSCVALVVTSPPYFAGKEYETALGKGGVPATYLEYLYLLHDVFEQCVQKLEPGGRIAVNVANLGRRPYRSLSADVIGILQDELHLLLRGEIIWIKQRGSSGSCAWGSFQRPGNPVLRDLTERVIIASKGRFDRAIPGQERARHGLPSESSMTRDDFMENTLDVWEIPAESATRIGHPAPFPIELPARLIEMYTYRGDLVLDPFAGSGTTAVAALRAGRHFVGYDLDESYVRLAESRVDNERQQLLREASSAPGRVRVPAIPAPASPDEDFQSRAVREGRTAKEIARLVIEAAGFTDIQKDQHQPGGVEVNFTARDSRGKPWFFDVAGSFTTHRGGLKRSDTLWKALGKAAVLREASKTPVVLLTTDAPARGAGAEALKQVVGPKKPIHAVIEMLKPTGLEVLTALCEGQRIR